MGPIGVDGHPRFRWPIEESPFFFFVAWLHNGYEFFGKSTAVSVLCLYRNIMQAVLSTYLDMYDFLLCFFSAIKLCCSVGKKTRTTGHHFHVLWTMCPASSESWNKSIVTRGSASTWRTSIANNPPTKKWNAAHTVTPIRKDAKWGERSSATLKSWKKLRKKEG